MSQAHTSGSQSWPTVPKGVTIVCTIVSALAAIALLALVGSESAAGAALVCTPGVRKAIGSLLPFATRGDAVDVEEDAGRLLRERRGC